MPVSAGHPPKYQQDSRARFDRYEERQKIGTWEHGDIYSARHQGLDCRVTMRVLELTDETSPELKTQFIERAKAISGLNHPNTVQTMEAGIDEDVAFIVQPQFEAKPIEGFQPRGLLERSAEGFFPNSALNTTMRAVVAALSAIHEQGIVHGNINSKSIVVCPSGVVRLTGLIESQVTNTIDPPAEVCPQHSIRADILQLGCAFFHITTQSHPESHLCNQTAKQISAKLKKKNPGLQKSIRDVIARCLTFGGSSYQDCSEILAELARASEQITLRVPWRLRIYSLACEFVALALLVPVVVFLFSSSGETFDSLMWPIAMLAYPILMETIFGFTIARRIFGLKLCDHSGDVAFWGRRSFRSVLRIAILIGAIMIPSIVLSMFTEQTFTLVAILMTVMPLLIYTTAFFSKSRWTIYDLVSGASWAEHFNDKLLGTEKAHDSSLRKQRVASEPIDRVDQYEIMELLGSGGMGNVYLAHDPTINRDVAIKVLADDLANDPGIFSRFESEAAGLGNCRKSLGQSTVPILSVSKFDGGGDFNLHSIQNPQTPSTSRPRNRYYRDSRLRSLSVFLGTWENSDFLESIDFKPSFHPTHISTLSKFKTERPCQRTPNFLESVSPWATRPVSAQNCVCVCSRIQRSQTTACRLYLAMLEY
jgi:serine/threonine protein kinase